MDSDKIKKSVNPLNGNFSNTAQKLLHLVMETRDNLASALPGIKSRLPQAELRHEISLRYSFDLCKLATKCLEAALSALQECYPYSPEEIEGLSHRRRKLLSRYLLQAQLFSLKACILLRDCSCHLERLPEEQRERVDVKNIETITKALLVSVAEAGQCSLELEEGYKETTLPYIMACETVLRDNIFLLCTSRNLKPESRILFAQLRDLQTYTLTRCKEMLAGGGGLSEPAAYSTFLSISTTLCSMLSQYVTTQCHDPRTQTVGNTAVVALSLLRKAMEDMVMRQSDIATPIISNLNVSQKMHLLTVKFTQLQIVDTTLSCALHVASEIPAAELCSFCPEVRGVLAKLENLTKVVRNALERQSENEIAALEEFLKDSITTALQELETYAQDSGGEIPKTAHCYLNSAVSVLTELRDSLLLEDSSIPATSAPTAIPSQESLTTPEQALESEPETPGTGTDVTTSELETPGTGTDATTSELETPGTGTDATTSGLKTPGASADATTSVLETPGTSADVTTSRSETPGASADATTSELETPGTSAATTTSGSETMSQEKLHYIEVVRHMVCLDRLLEYSVGRFRLLQNEKYHVFRAAIKCLLKKTYTSPLLSSRSLLELHLHSLTLPSTVHCVQEVLEELNKDLSPKIIEMCSDEMSLLQASVNNFQAFAKSVLPEQKLLPEFKDPKSTIDTLWKLLVSIDEDQITTESLEVFSSLYQTLEIPGIMTPSAYLETVLSESAAFLGLSFEHHTRPRIFPLSVFESMLRREDFSNLKHLLKKLIIGPYSNLHNILRACEDYLESLPPEKARTGLENLCSDIFPLLLKEFESKNKKYNLGGYDIARLVALCTLHSPSPFPLLQNTRGYTNYQFSEQRFHEVIAKEKSKWKEAYRATSFFRYLSPTKQCLACVFMYYVSRLLTQFFEPLQRFFCKVIPDFFRRFCHFVASVFTNLKTRCTEMQEADLTEAEGAVSVRSSSTYPSPSQEGVEEKKTEPKTTQPQQATQLNTIAATVLEDVCVSSCAGKAESLNNVQIGR